MITRSFLFLLALVTGFSAANAQDRSRGVHHEIGLVASVVLVRSITAQTENQVNAPASYSCARPITLAASSKLVEPLASAIVTNPRTYRGDRARE